ncbi:putative terminase small subunit gpNu1 [Acidithiobacillus phage AcaML1]|nr:putative terminase small subunit gpNu1 [Acidithiobacillus phage AcaML1]
MACGQACLVGRHQGALDGPDADVVEVQAVPVAGFQGLDEEMVQGDPGEQLVQLLGGLVGSFSHHGSPWRVLLWCLYERAVQAESQAFGLSISHRSGLCSTLLNRLLNRPGNGASRPTPSSPSMTGPTGTGCSRRSPQPNPAAGRPAARRISRR